MTDALAVSDLTKRHDGTTALEDVTVAFDPGALHLLAGPNGSGKTTLLRVLAGLAEPTAGTVTRPSAVGCAFQRPSLYPSLTVAENLEVFARLVGAEDSWREHLVDRLDLAPIADQPAGALSDGQAAALDLALALLKRPGVLLLDEPLVALDASRRRRVLELVAGYPTSDRAVVLSTHEIDAVADLCDRLVVLADGAVALDARTSALETDPASAYEGAVASRPGRG